jgi:predicted outer membrane lipoprotein
LLPAIIARILDPAYYLARLTFLGSYPALGSIAWLLGTLLAAPRSQTIVPRRPTAHGSEWYSSGERDQCQWAKETLGSGSTLRSMVWLLGTLLVASRGQIIVPREAPAPGSGLYSSGE